MAEFTPAYNITRKIEGGFWNDPTAGYTYAGITSNNYPAWPGFARLRALGAKYGGIQNIPRYTVFKDALLDKMVQDFKIAKFWQSKMNGNYFTSQDMANMVYDFLIHKENDAIAVINQVARKFNPGVHTEKYKLSADVISILNKNYLLAYPSIVSARKAYYRNHKKFSQKMKAAFIDRVEKFPAMAAVNARTILQTIDKIIL